VVSVELCSLVVGVLVVGALVVDSQVVRVAGARVVGALVVVVEAAPGQELPRGPQPSHRQGWNAACFCVQPYSFWDRPVLQCCTHKLT